LISLKDDTPTEAPGKRGTTILFRLRAALGSPPPQPPPGSSHDPPAVSMEQVLPALERVLTGLV